MSATLTAVLSGPGTRAHAQSPAIPATTPHQTCGWNPEELRNGVPLSITSLSERAGTPIPPEALAKLRSWTTACDEGDGKRAVYELRRLSNAHPADMAVASITGITLARGPEVQIKGASGVWLRPAFKFTNSEKEAVRLLSKVSERTRWSEPALALAHLGLGTRAEATLEAARKALTVALENDPGNAGMWNALADTHLARSEPADALVAARRGMALGDLSSARRAAIAMMLTARDPAVGAELYINTLKSADAALVDAYYEDVALLLTEPEVAEWDAQRESERSKWLTKVWQWRASIAAQTLPARLAEHFRRTSYAFGNYRRNAFMGARPVSALWLDEKLQKLPLDDRGLTYVRHGAPDKVVQAPPGTLSSRIGWYYRSLAGGRAFLEFDNIASERTPAEGGVPLLVRWGDYFMTEPFRCGGLDQTDEARARMDDYAVQVNLIDPSLHADKCSNTIAGDVGKYVARNPSNVARRLVSAAVMQTESAAPKITKPLVVLLNTYAFSRDGQTLVAAVASFDGERITPFAPPAVYGLQIFSAVENTVSHDVTRVDTLHQLHRRTALGRGDILRIPMLLPAAEPGNATVRFSIRNVADTLQGQIVATNREIPAFVDGRLTVSDIVIGGAADGDWLSGSPAPLPIPGHRMVAGATFRVFHELYGTQAGESFKVRLTITPDPMRGLTGVLSNLIDRKEALSIEFQERPDRAPNGVAAVVRDIQLPPDFKSGTYFLETTVQSLDGTKVASSRTEIVVDKD